MGETNVQDTEVLLAGAVKRPITPTVRGRRVFIAGYRRGRLATDIHDELWVRALALRHRDTTLILVVLDLLGLFRSDVESIRDLVVREGAPGEGLVVTCTHNHAGPDTLGLWGHGLFGSEPNLRYMSFLRREVAHVALLALDALQPVKAYMVRSEAADLVGDGQSRELAVLQLRAQAGKPLATLVNYPLVPQVLDEKNTAISADFPNWLCRQLERSRDEVVLYICADAGERVLPAVQERSWAEAERVGRELAAAVRAALDGAPPTTVDRLHVRRKPFSIPDDDPTAKWLRHVRPFYQRALSERRPDSEVGLVQLGSARLAILPGLVSPQLGLEMRKMLDTPYRFLLCMSNDNLGAILSPQWTSPQSTGRQMGHSTLDGSQVGTILLDEVDRLMLEMQELPRE